MWKSSRISTIALRVGTPSVVVTAQSAIQPNAPLVGGNGAFAGYPFAITRTLCVAGNPGRNS